MRPFPHSALCTSASNLPPTKGWPIRWPCHQYAVPDCRETAGLHHFSWPPEPWKARGALFPFHVTFYNAQDAAFGVGQGPCWPGLPSRLVSFCDVGLMVMTVTAVKPAHPVSLGGSQCDEPMKCSGWVAAPFIGQLCLQRILWLSGAL